MRQSQKQRKQKKNSRRQRGGDPVSDAKTKLLEKIGSIESVITEIKTEIEAIPVPEATPEIVDTNADKKRESEGQGEGESQGQGEGESDNNSTPTNTGKGSTNDTEVITDMEKSDQDGGRRKSRKNKKNNKKRNSKRRR